MLTCCLKAPAGDLTIGIRNTHNTKPTRETPAKINCLMHEAFAPNFRNSIRGISLKIRALSAQAGMCFSKQAQVACAAALRAPPAPPTVVGLLCVYVNVNTVFAVGLLLAVSNGHQYYILQFIHASYICAPNNSSDELVVMPWSGLLVFCTPKCPLQQTTSKTRSIDRCLHEQ